jgi:hypothetical protein
LLLQLLYGHEPFLACAVDDEWNLLASNSMLEMLVGPIAPALLVPPINVMRLVLHPQGMAPRLANLTEVHTHLVRRLRRRLAITGTDSLMRLDEQVAGYRQVPEPPAGPVPPTVPLRLWVGPTLVNLISSPVFFGTPWDASPASVSAECLFPADESARTFLFDGPGLPVFSTPGRDRRAGR